MKKLALLLFSSLLFSCSSSNNDDILPKDQNAIFTYSVEGSISFTKGGTQHQIPLFASVSYKDASGNMVTEAITTSQWEKKITLKTDKPFPSKIILKYNKVADADDEKTSITRTSIIRYFVDGNLSKLLDSSSTMTMTTNRLNKSLESRGDYESVYDVTFD